VNHGDPRVSQHISGSLTAIGITDISRIKWAENLQARRLHEAEETRRAQNSFIDITSHEMRNPLSKDTFPPVTSN
jgi:hypothetical protein